MAKGILESYHISSGLIGKLLSEGHLKAMHGLRTCHFRSSALNLNDDSVTYQLGGPEKHLKQSEP